MKRHGPFRDDARDLVAYVVSVGSRADRRDFCVVSTADIAGDAAFTEIVDHAPEAVLGWGRAYYANWQRVRSWKAVVHPGARSNTYELWPVPLSATIESPAKLARAVLASMVAVKPATTTPEHLTAYAGTAGGGAFVPVEIQVPGSDVGLGVMLGKHGYDAIEHLVREGLLEKVFELSADQYLREAVTFADHGQWAFAFRAFYYGTVTPGPDGAFPKETALRVGRFLTSEFRDAGQWDFGEWIASRTAGIARELGDRLSVAEAHREAGMACEALGRIADALVHYDQALGALPPDAPVRLQAQVHMSIGVTSAVGLSHFEASGQDRDGLDAPTRRRIESALRHLDTASHLYQSLGADVVGPRLAVEIDRLRLVDLLGQHEEALEGLGAALSDMGDAGFPALRASVLAYRVACTKKLVDTAGTHLDEFRGLIDFIVENREELIAYPPDRTGIWMALAGRVALADRQADVAAECFELGLMRQEHVLSSQIRVLTPDDIRLGPLSIDFAGMLQLAQLAHPWPTRPSRRQPHRRAYLTAEDAKGRFFRRNLELGLRVSAAAGLEKGYRQRLNMAIRDGKYDERIVYADSEWLEQGAGDATWSFPVASDDQILVDLYGGLPARTVVISFYAMAERTLLYAADDPRVLRLAATLEVPMKEVAAAGQLMRAHFSRHPLHPMVKANDPDRYRARYLRPFENLVPTMEPVAEIISDYDLAVLIPHGPWHALPVHAMVLPLTWRSGRSTGIVYAPSLGVLASLVRRFQERELLRRLPSGVMTVPHHGNDPSQFQQLHDQLAANLSPDGRMVLGVYGAEATLEALAESLGVVGIQHLLAHGVTDPRRALGSGLMLGAEGLPPAALSVDGVTSWPGFLSAASLAGFDIAADHVTVQACSLGTVTPGVGEEFWGVIRSLLLAGASTVMAPLWDVHPESSTALLVEFYRRWLKRRQPRWEAWTDAQRSMYEATPSDAWSHYYHWAPFRMIGVP